MEFNVIYYGLILLAIIIGVLVVKKIASCLIRSIVLIVLIALLAFIYYAYVYTG
jgi:hypothetical protein